MVVLREEDLKISVITARQAEKACFSLVLLSTIPMRLGNLIHSFLQAFLMMFEKLIIRHLANSLLKTLPEELTSKISSLLGDVKKQTEMGKKNRSHIPRSTHEVLSCFLGYKSSDVLSSRHKIWSEDQMNLKTSVRI